MDGYRRKVFRSYLEKQPDMYSGPLPAQAIKETKEVSLLTPEVEAVEFHKYPNEYAIVIEGNNLWFCHKIHIGNKGNVYKIDTPVQDITRRSIQFNFTPSDGEKCIVPDNGHMEITLYSHFANPINETVPVKQVSIFNMIILYTSVNFAHLFRHRSPTLSPYGKYSWRSTHQVR